MGRPAVHGWISDSVGGSLFASIISISPLTRTGTLGQNFQQGGRDSVSYPGVQIPYQYLGVTGVSPAIEGALESVQVWEILVVPGEFQ